MLATYPWEPPAVPVPESIMEGSTLQSQWSSSQRIFCVLRSEEQSAGLQLLPSPEHAQSAEILMILHWCFLFSSAYKKWVLMCWCVESLPRLVFSRFLWIISSWNLLWRGRTAGVTFFSALTLWLEYSPGNLGLFPPFIYPQSVCWYLCSGKINT